MTNKPEKRKLSKDMLRDYLQYDKGYNHCYDNWESYIKGCEERIINKLKDIQFKDFIPINGVRGTNKVTLHFRPRKRITKAIIKAILEEA